MAAEPSQPIEEVAQTTGPLVPTAKPPTETVLSSMTADDRDLLDRLLSTPIDHVDHPALHRKRADVGIFGVETRLTGPYATQFKPAHPVVVPARPASKPQTLNIDQEQLLFLRFNYARAQVGDILRKHTGKRLTATATRQLLAWGRRAQSARSEIVHRNIPLVLAMAKRTRLSGIDYNELISEGNMALLRSVEKFDCGRGYKFSTYSCRAILKSFSRVAMRASRYRGRFPVEFDPAIEKSDFVERRREEHDSNCVDELKAILVKNLAELNDVERTVIHERFALSAVDPTAAQPKTLEQVGLMIGVTKERVRQIQNRALQKIRIALEESYLVA